MSKDKLVKRARALSATYRGSPLPPHRDASCVFATCANRIERDADELTRLRAELAAAREALRPFAETAAWVERHWPTVKNYQGLEIVCAPLPEHHFTVGDLDRARAALGDKP